MNFLCNTTIFSLYKIKTTLNRTLKGKYSEIDTDTKCESYSDIDYDSNYDKIFKDEYLELDGQTLSINKLDS